MGKREGSRKAHLAPTGLQQLPFMAVSMYVWFCPVCTIDNAHQFPKTVNLRVWASLCVFLKLICYEIAHLDRCPHPLHELELTPLPHQTLDGSSSQGVGHEQRSSRHCAAAVAQVAQVEDEAAI